MGHIVSIHQPNFMPWLGYFYKIAQSDTFIFLNDAEFSKGSYTNRSKILVNAKSKWLTVPIQYESSRAINEVAIGATDWRDRHLSVLKQNYRKSKYFEEIYPIVESIYSNESHLLLANFNIEIIKRLCKLLDIKTKTLLSSDYHIKERGDIRLRLLLEKIGGTDYLSGSGGRNYQEDDTFISAGIKLHYSDFSPKPYNQLSSEFVPGLSIVDALFNIGSKEVSSMLNTQLITK